MTIKQDQSYYRYHVFFCVNQRDDGSACCANRGSIEMRDYAKNKVKELGMRGRGQVRVNNAGCLDRCEEGPVMVIYPEGVWYTYVDSQDVDEIIESHLKRGKVVERLKI
jgi:(2Fe-2S) ferredoxin